MSTINQSSIKAPYRDELVDDSNFLARSWQSFFRLIEDVLFYIGQEKNVKLQNNVASIDGITFLTLDKTKETFVHIEIAAQRISDLDKYLAFWDIWAFYNPDLDSWSYDSNEHLIDFASTPNQVGFNLGSNGVIQYYTTNFLNSIIYDRMAFRKRSMAMKDSRYSRLG